MVPRHRLRAGARGPAPRPRHPDRARGGARLTHPVMLALVASTDVLNTALREGRRGWSGQARP
ncbi:hypothetical protein BOS5A_200126 [Bosea sp. EC-HK365B]|nr:hypothetical protein BOSE21B_100128 [Bosea sp. 21B]CAD5286119.1 hypothetical protein BOSE7B_41401 [Bosea sp. 7B]VVT57498.1 hypothetical protein BOS5A_200126 [Bosea sp. EC-HK365B]VXC94014.1 hypothetical protein BOSE127_80187 [Bosea sp. 127]